LKIQDAGLSPHRFVHVSGSTGHSLCDFTVLLSLYLLTYPAEHKNDG
jgi:hypothetical protein